MTTVDVAGYNAVVERLNDVVKERNDLRRRLEAVREEAEAHRASRIVLIEEKVALQDRVEAITKDAVTLNEIRLKLEIANEELQAAIAFLKERKSLYKTKVRNVETVINAAKLLDNAFVFVRVIEDALSKEAV